MSFYNAISEKVILPVSDIATGQQVASKLNFLLQSRYWNREQLNDFQNKKLKTLLQHAFATVPYYQTLFKELGLEPADISNSASLSLLPILNKKIIKQKQLSFIAAGIPDKLKMKRSSSGSTGEPLFYLTTKEAYSMNIAANLRGWYEMGYRLGDRFMKISQNARKSKIKRVQDFITRNRYIKADPLNETNFRNILLEIAKFKPKVIRCYPDPLLFLARYMAQHPEFSYSPDCINTTGNTLHPETRKEIEEAFKCSVFDSYSSEGNSCVFECSLGSGYHSAEEYGITEVLDENGNPIKKGIGRLVSTDLWNLAHPFIRYDTQDYVEVDDQPCACGRSHLKIKRILGRDNEILKLANGKSFIVHNFTIFFSNDTKKLNRSVDQFQVTKKKDGSVVFCLKVNNNYNSEIGEFIKSSWHNTFETNVEIELVQAIQLTSSGKRRFILNEP